MSQAVPGTKGALGDGVLCRNCLECLLKGKVQLGWGKGYNRLERFWVAVGSNVSDHLQEAGLLGVVVGVSGLLVTLGDSQVEGQVLGWPTHVLPKEGT